QPLVVELRAVTGDGLQLLLEGGADVHDERGLEMALLRVEGERSVDQVRDAVRRGVVEAIVPLRQLRVETRRLDEERSLMMVGRGSGRTAERAYDDTGPVAAEGGPQDVAIGGAIHQFAVGQLQVDAQLHA